LKVDEELEDAFLKLQHSVSSHDECLATCEDKVVLGADMLGVASLHFVFRLSYVLLSVIVLQSNLIKMKFTLQTWFY